jgi:hypothetical protein
LKIGQPGFGVVVVAELSPEAAVRVGFWREIVSIGVRVVAGYYVQLESSLSTVAPRKSNV